MSDIDEIMAVVPRLPAEEAGLKGLLVGLAEWREGSTAWKTRDDLMAVIGAAGENQVFVTGMASRLELGVQEFKATVVVSAAGFKRMREWQKR